MDPAPVRAVDDGDDNTSRFLMQGYKVIPCSKRYRHDWSVCPFAHTGEMAARRDPKLYLPIFCYHSKQRLPCPRGESCPHAHNLFEYWLHPARYRTELCQFGMGCTRPVCFFAHNEAQLRHTGMPGGPQPVVAPPEPIMGAPGAPGGPPGLGAPPGGAAGPHRGMAQDQLLLSSISEAAVKMQMHEAGGGALSGPLPGRGMGVSDQALSDVLPVLGGAASNSQRAGRGAGAAFGAHAPAGALKSMPLPRLDWAGAPAAAGGAADAAALLAQVQQQMGYGAPGGAAGPSGDLSGLDASAALALAQAQLAAGGGGAPDARRAAGLRRSISEAAAVAGGPPPRRGGNAPLDVQALLAATSAAMAGPGAAALPQAPGAGPASAAALIDSLQRQLAAMQFAAAGDDASAAAALALATASASAPLNNSAPLPPIGGGSGGAAAALLSQRTDVAALAAALAAQQQQIAAAVSASAAASAPASPGAPAPAPTSSPPTGAFDRAPGSRAASPQVSFTSASTRSPAASVVAAAAPSAEALLMIGDEGVGLDKLQEQLADAPRRSSPSLRDAGAASAPLPKTESGMGREAAAQLLAQMPESTVRDLLRVLAAGQAVLSQQAA